jgi:GTP-binding protein
MRPTLVIVGRPNVGKSTLFNRLTRSRDALVADVPGLTRDRHYGEGRIGDQRFLVVDTGGLEPVSSDGMLQEMAKQTQLAIAEADALVFLVDGRAGLTPQDVRIAQTLRRARVPVRVAVNKTEGMNAPVVTAEFHELGLGMPVAISAAHGEGVRELVEDLLEGMAGAGAETEPDPAGGPRIAVVGRPNVGKSTLINALLGEERMIAFDLPGTTRDAIEVPFERDGRRYTLIDTAGIRRRGKVFESIEKFSVIKTLQAIDQANVVVLVLDATERIADQDAHLAGFILERGRALVVAVNKWDAADEYARTEVRRQLAHQLNFLSFARTRFVAARSASGLGSLMASVDEAYRSAMTKLGTPRLSRVLQSAVERQAPPRAGLTRPKMRYAHQGGMNPPVIVIHGNALDRVPDSYRRYLESSFRSAFELVGTPLRVEFKTGRNPYAAKG